MGLKMENVVLPESSDVTSNFCRLPVAISLSPIVVCIRHERNSSKERRGAESGEHSQGRGEFARPN